MNVIDHFSNYVKYILTKLQWLRVKNLMKTGQGLKLHGTVIEIYNRIDAEVNVTYYHHLIHPLPSKIP